MTLKSDIEEACKTHDIHSILGVPHHKKTMVCPLPMHQHGNYTPSFSIYWKNGRQWWKCHGNCGEEGDAVDLIGFLFVPGYRKADPPKQRQALENLDSRYEFKLPIKPKITRLRPLEYQEYLPPGPGVLEYAKKRGLSQETVDTFHIGQFNNWMTIPAFEEGELKGIKMRRINQGEPRFIQKTGSLATLFNYDRVALVQKPVLIVKGEIPVMLLHQHGILACAGTVGEKRFDDDWVTALALATKKVVVGDNDPTGIAGAKQRAAQLHCELRFPPAQFKDIDEWILAQPQAIQEIKKWLN